MLVILKNRIFTTFFIILLIFINHTTFAVDYRSTNGMNKINTNNALKTNVIPVFFASNEKYAPYVAVSMASILYNTNSFINFYIIDGGITNSTKKLIELLNKKFDNFSIEFIKIDTDKFFSDFADNKIYGSLDIYSRFLIPILKPSLNKVIYLDADTIVIDDINKLYSENIDNYYIGAVDETTSASCPKEMDISPSHRYFNSGVLLINSKKWREENIINKLFELGKKYSKYLAYPDQDILNKAFENNYKILDNKYNASDGTKKSNEDQNVVVRHFIGIKPDNLIDKYYYDINYKNINEFWFYAEMTPFHEGLQNYFIASKIDNLEKNLAWTFENIYDKKQKENRVKNMYYAIGSAIITTSILASIFLIKILVRHRKTKK